LVLGLLVVAASYVWRSGEQDVPPQGRQEELFWHFWGGEDRKTVDAVVQRFNASQEQYFVRAVAMPGNNLDLKVFLAVTGGDPPDVINQDDPIVADWAQRGALTPIDELAPPAEVAALRQWLFPAARRLGEYDGRLYALCNGLDIRALYYNRTLLEEHGLAPPQSLEELDRIAAELSQFDEQGRLVRAGYLPNPDRLIAWGYVFGGEFYDPQSGRATVDDEPIVRALDWMAGYSRRFGPRKVAAFRPGGQTLPGKTFSLLSRGDASPHGPYAAIMDGQWQVNEIAASQAARRERGLPTAEYGVCPLPAPPGGRERAGWVNGNFFVVPRGAKHRAGAWAFMKFWSGFGGHERDAAETCAAGGWIPVSPRVVERPEFRAYVEKRPLFGAFVELAGSENQFPVPVIPGAPLLDREVKSAAERVMNDPRLSSRDVLQHANERIQTHLDRL
jgi:multiple sugar transport system substrate-binding protein